MLFFACTFHLPSSPPVLVHSFPHPNHVLPSPVLESSIAAEYNSILSCRKGPYSYIASDFIDNRSWFQTFKLRLMNLGCALPPCQSISIAFSLLPSFLLSAIDSAEEGTTLPPYLQRLPTRQEPKNGRKKESSDARLRRRRRRRHLKIKKIVLHCVSSREEKGTGNVSHFVGKRIDV